MVSVCFFQLKMNNFSIYNKHQRKDINLSYYTENDEQIMGVGIIIAKQIDNKMNFGCYQ